MAHTLPASLIYYNVKSQVYNTRRGFYSPNPGCWFDSIAIVQHILPLDICGSYYKSLSGLSPMVSTVSSVYDTGGVIQRAVVRVMQRDGMSSAI